MCLRPHQDLTRIPPDSAPTAVDVMPTVPVMPDPPALTPHQPRSGAAEASPRASLPEYIQPSPVAAAPPTSSDQEGGNQEGGSHSPPTRRQPLRQVALRNQGWKTGRYDKGMIVDVFHISFKDAMQNPTRSASMREAAIEEIRNLIKNEVAIPVLQFNASNQPVPTHMFFKVKHKADGSLDKIKARLVANETRQVWSPSKHWRNILTNSQPGDSILHAEHGMQA